jgi:drug/metabolite transporter (DMT)-like permease
LQKFDALSDNLKGAAFLMVAAFLLTLSVALIKQTGSRLPVAQILFCRQMGMLLCLSPALVKSAPDVVGTKRPGLQLVRIFFALIALFGGYTAVIHMPLADAMAIGFAKSFFVTVFAVLLLGEKVGRYRWGAVALGFVGVAIMLKPDVDGFNIYGLYALFGAAAAGIVMVIIRILTRTETSQSILAFQAFGVGAVMLIPALTTWVAPTPKEWILLLLIGVVSYFAQASNIFAYKHGEASMLASLEYVRLLYATLLGYLFFQQLPQMTTWIGAAIIVAAAVFTVYRESQVKQTITRAPTRPEL